MEIDVNSVVLSARVYASLRERFFIGNHAGDAATGHLAFGRSLHHTSLEIPWQREFLVG